MAKKGGGKKKKKSAEEIEAERIAAEEEERLRLLEEEKKRIEEEETRRREEEAERKRRARLRKEELERLNDESLNTHALAERRIRYHTQYWAERKSHDEWASYLKCSRLPSISANSNLNTYLSAILDEPVENIDVVMSHCQELQDVNDQFELAHAELLAKSDFKMAKDCREKKFRVFATLIRKLDMFSAYILSHPEKFSQAKLEVLVGKQTDKFKFGTWINLASKGFRMKIIDFPDIAIIAEIPKALALQSIAVRTIYCSNDSVTQVPADGKSFDVALGGTLFLETLKLPPMAKVVKGWTMRPIDTMLNTNVQRLNFNAMVAGVAADAAGTPPVSVTLKFKVSNRLVVRDVEGKHVKMVKEEMEEAQANKQSFAVAGTAKEASTLRVGAWDHTLGQWVQEGISDALFDSASRVVTFSTTKMTVLSLLQSRTIDYPFRHWHLAPIFSEGPKENTGETTEDVFNDYEDPDQSLVYGVELAIETEWWLIKIEIDFDGNCKLTKPELPELEHILGVPMAGTKLLSELMNSGINLYSPITSESGCESYLDGALKPKAIQLEKRVYEEVSAAVSSSFHVSMDPWNQTVGSDECSISLYEVEDGQGKNDLYKLMEEELRMMSPQGEGKEIDMDKVAETKEETKTSSPRTEGDDETPQTAGSKSSDKKRNKKDKKKNQSAKSDSAKSATTPGAPGEEDGEVAVVTAISSSKSVSILFQIDDQVPEVGIKCAMIPTSDSAESFAENCEKNQATFIYLENALQAQEIYNTNNIHMMQDSPESTALRSAIYSVLVAIRPLSFGLPRNSE
mmetsp:Transcript_38837/g.62544  ORF Transcript_38837/g.62544 Transcript_38837/m.62544 type:complete len:798 (+) Transcript_38837:93-2486(+)